MELEPGKIYNVEYSGEMQRARYCGPTVHPDDSSTVGHLFVVFLTYQGEPLQIPLISHHIDSFVKG